MSFTGSVFRLVLYRCCLPGVLAQKRQQCVIDMLWRLPLEKVAIMAEIPGLSLGKYRPPGVLQQPCPHGFSRSYPAGAKQEQERRCQLLVRVRLPLRWVFVRRGAVVVEAAAQRPGLGVCLDVVRHFLVADGVLVHAPIPENMPQIDLLAAFDELFRQIVLLMEVGVPALSDHLRLLRPITLARRGGV